MTPSITSHFYLFSSASPSGSINKIFSSFIANVSYVKRYSVVSMYSFAVISDAIKLSSPSLKL